MEDEPPILMSLKAMIDRSNTPFMTEATSFNGKDALELIKEHRPHVVLTDINMPIMDGLEMITKAKLISPNTRFIILSGYNDFEYARTALRLGVSDYILKPVRQEALYELLNQVASKISEGESKLESEYIRAELGLWDHTSENQAILSNTLMHIFFIYAGTTIKKSYEASGIPSYNWDRKDKDELINKSTHLCDRMYAFNGKYPNELIIAAVWDLPGEVDAEQLGRLVFDWAKNDQSFINLIMTKPIQNGIDIKNKANQAVDAIFKQMLFAQDRIHQYSHGASYNKRDMSVAIKEEIKELTFMRTEEQLSKKLKGIIAYWQANQYTQVEVIDEIDYLFSAIKQRIIIKTGSFNHKVLTGELLLALATNYDELYKNLLKQVKTILVSHTEISSARELVDQIEDYLEKNFASDITYKVLEDRFGYNKKYISNIFKEEKGISPNKYVTNVRINMAKTLMRQNPDTLIKDIAQAIGYKDQLYFSRVFREVTGKSPSQFIKSLD